MCSKLRNVKHWCKTSRSKSKLRPLWDKFTAKLRGHIQYYSVSLNSDGVSSFVYQAVHIFFKWINHRSQRKSMSWEQFSMFLKAFPAPVVKICHHLFWFCVVKWTIMSLEGWFFLPAIWVMSDRQPITLIGYDGLELGTRLSDRFGLPPSLITISA